MDPVTEERIKFTNKLVDKYTAQLNEIRKGQSSADMEMAHVHR